MSKMRTVQTYSAGGIVFRKRKKSDSAEGEKFVTEVVLVGRSVSGMWGLPKGTPQRGESVEEVAMREVREETGLQVRIIDKLGSIHYWFSRHGVRYLKEVIHYLMEPTGGDLSLHDHEYDVVQWFPIAQAASSLTYPNEAELVRQAAQVIEQLGLTPRVTGD